MIPLDSACLNQRYRHASITETKYEEIGQLPPGMNICWHWLWADNTPSKDSLSIEQLRCNEPRFLHCWVFLSLTWLKGFLGRFLDWKSKELPLLLHSHILHGEKVIQICNKTHTHTQMHRNTQSLFDHHPAQNFYTAAFHSNPSVYTGTPPPPCLPSHHTSLRFCQKYTFAKKIGVMISPNRGIPDH